MWSGRGFPLSNMICGGLESTGNVEQGIAVSSWPSPCRARWTVMLSFILGRSGPGPERQREQDPGNGPRVGILSPWGPLIGWGDSSDQV